MLLGRLITGDKIFVKLEINMTMMISTWKPTTAFYISSSDGEILRTPLSLCRVQDLPVHLVTLFWKAGRTFSRDVVAS